MPKMFISISTINGLKDSEKVLSGDHEASNLSRSVEKTKSSPAKQCLETDSAPSNAQFNLSDQRNRSLRSSAVPASLPDGIFNSTSQPYCTMPFPTSFPAPVMIKQPFYSYGIPLDQQRKDRDAIDKATLARLDASLKSSTESDDSPPPYQEKSESSTSPSKKPRKLELSKVMLLFGPMKGGVFR